jgi:hypothetical protein
MKLTSQVARRTIGMLAVASTAVLVPAVALAASGSATTPQSAAAPQSAAIGRCLTRQLDDWIGIPGNGTAGSTYYELEISNISASTCTLDGYPGVSALRGNSQLGSAAGRDPSHPDTLVTLAPGATSHVILQITDVGVYPPSACKPELATSLRVYAPGAYASLRIPFEFQACARRGPVYLHVTATITGTGIPGHSV